YPRKPAPGMHSLDDSFDDLLERTLRAESAIDLELFSHIQTRDYNAKLDTFYSRWEAYLREEHAFREPECRRIQFAIEIRNTGTAPAEDVDVSFHFPDGFRLMTEDDLPVAPRQPESPDESGHGRLARLVERKYASMPRPSVPSAPPIRIVESTSYD